jgi:hypothetical protein
MMVTSAVSAMIELNRTTRRVQSSKFAHPASVSDCCCGVWVLDIGAQWSVTEQPHGSTSQDTIVSHFIPLYCSKKLKVQFPYFG